MRRYRAYQREYQKRWRAAHLAKLRDYNREYAQRWRAAHRERVRRVTAAWRRRNIQKVRTQNRKWYALHGKAYYRRNQEKARQQARVAYRKERASKAGLEQWRARKRRYSLKNRERIGAERRAKRRQNPDHFRALDRARYRRDRLNRIAAQRKTMAKRYKAPGQWTAKQFHRLLKEAGHRCAYCGSPLTKRTATADHILPLSRGGTNWIKNIAPACLPCNRQKHAMTAEEFRKHRPITN